MDNRFGFKELVVSVLLVALIVIVLLAMKQYDRQWETLRRIDQRLAEQNTTLIALNDTLRSARLSAATPPANSTASGQSDDSATHTPEDDPFYRVLAPRENPDFAFGDWFVDVFRQTVGKLTPLVVDGDAYTSQVGGFVLESLLMRDPETLEWRPWIARNWEVSDDGLTITFDLRENVKFSDGEPLTSEDVVFTYEFINNPEINTPQLRSYYENFESVTANGPHRVVFALREPYFLSLEFAGGLPILPQHYYARFTPEEFNTMPGLLMGTGPYMLPMPPEEWQPGSGAIELVRNERYWGPRPTFDRLVWREISDETAQLVAFRNSEIDRYSVTPERYGQLKDDAALLAKADLYEYSTPNSGYRYIGWNQRKNGEPTIFADERVRRALTMLTNREEMAQQLMAGLATVANGPFNPLGSQAAPDVEAWPYDPSRARGLLAEAGWTDRDNDGVLENEQDQEFRFKLIYPSNSQNYQQMAFYLKDAYARAGVVLEPDPTEWNTMLQRIDERNFDGITLGWTGSIEGDPKQIFHSDSIAAGGSNHISYANADLDALIDKARVTMDREKRLAMWRDVHRILHEDQPYTFLFFSKAVGFMDKRIRNVQITRTGMNDETEMYVPTELQRWGD